MRGNFRGLQANLTNLEARDGRRRGRRYDYVRRNINPTEAKVLSIMSPRGHRLPFSDKYQLSALAVQNLHFHRASRVTTHRQSYLQCVIVLIALVNRLL